MSITTSEGGTTIDGPDIELYRWITLRAALKLEATTGMKLSRRMSAQQAAKRNFGLKGSMATIRAAVDAKIAVLEKERAERVARGEG